MDHTRDNGGSLPHVGGEEAWKIGQANAAGNAHAYFPRRIRIFFPEPSQQDIDVAQDRAGFLQQESPRGRGDHRSRGARQ